MAERCPRCGFEHGWDGSTCRHCGYPAEAPAGPEQPRRDAILLREPLLYGTIAALVSVGLGAVSSWLSWRSGVGEEFTLADGLGLAAVLPEGVILWVFVSIADTLGPERLDSLKRSSVCTYAVGWLVVGLSALALFDPARTGWWFLLAMLAAGVVLALLFRFAVRASGGGFLILFLLYFAIRYSGWLFLGRPLDPGVTIALAVGLALVVSSFAYPVWFGISLIRARGLLGTPAALLGALHLAGVAAWVGVVVWMGYLLANAPEGLLKDGEALGEFLDAHWHGVSLLGAVGSLAVGLATALFFVGQRRRIVEGGLSTP